MLTCLRNDRNVLSFAAVDSGALFKNDEVFENLNTKMVRLLDPNLAYLIGPDFSPYYAIESIRTDKFISLLI